MSQIPSRILLSTRFLLFSIMFFGSQVAEERSSIAIACGILRISESTLKDICHHQHAVIAYAYKVSFGSIYPRIDLTRSFHDQCKRFSLGQLLGAHGFLRFHHKLFFDFLRDPARSNIFSVNAPAFQIKFFERLIQQHHRCASSYAIDGSSLCFPALCLLLNLLVVSELVLPTLLPCSPGHRKLNILTPSCGWHPFLTSWLGDPILCHPSFRFVAMLPCIPCDS